MLTPIPFVIAHASDTLSFAEVRIVVVLLIIDQLQVQKSFVLFLKTIVFNALIPNILLSRLSDEQKCIYFASKVGRF